MAPDGARARRCSWRDGSGDGGGAETGRPLRPGGVSAGTTVVAEPQSTTLPSPPEQGGAYHGRRSWAGNALGYDCPTDGE